MKSEEFATAQSFLDRNLYESEEWRICYRAECRPKILDRNYYNYYNSARSNFPLGRICNPTAISISICNAKNESGLQILIPNAAGYPAEWSEEWRICCRAEGWTEIIMQKVWTEINIIIIILLRGAIHLSPIYSPLLLERGREWGCGRVRLFVTK